MLFDIRRIQFHTLKEFAREYVMIVVGILTALAMEHVATTHHQNELAEQSRQRIAEELRLDLSEVHKAAQENAARLKQLAGVSQVISEAMASSQTLGEINQRVNAAFGGHGKMGVSIPVLRHESWDVAIADQSVGHIESDALRRYSVAYAAQRDYSALNAQGGLLLLVAPRAIEAIADLQRGEAEPAELRSVVALLTAALQTSQSNLLDLQDALEKSLKDEPGGKTAKAS